jgi:hypothetical protein
MEITPLRGDETRSQYHRDVATVDRESSMHCRSLLFTFCSHSTGKQLSFALGTPIPLFLEVCNEGISFHPKSIDIRLVRTLTTRGLSGGVREFEVARAVLWLAQGSSVHSTKLWGEILVGKILTPSFDFSNCSVRVRVPCSPAFAPPIVHDFEPVLNRAISSLCTR